MSELSEMVDRLKELADKGIEHPPVVRDHEGCEVCEMHDLAKLIKLHIDVMDDNEPQRQLGGKSRKEFEHARVTKRWDGLKKTREIMERRA